MRVLCAFALWLGLAAPVLGQAPVSIDETRLRAELRGGKTFVTVPVLNKTSERLRGLLKLSWLDPTGHSSDPVEMQLELPPGESTAGIQVALAESSTWLRLQYSLSPELQRSRLFPPLRGTVALGSIAAHVFELSAAGTGVLRPGEEFRVQVQAVHPSTKAPAQPER